LRESLPFSEKADRPIMIKRTSKRKFYLLPHKMQSYEPFQ